MKRDIARCKQSANGSGISHVPCDSITRWLVNLHSKAIKQRFATGIGSVSLAPVAKARNSEAKSNSPAHSFAARLWVAADTMRGHMDASGYNGESSSGVMFAQSEELVESHGGKCSVNSDNAKNLCLN
ncbi:MAG: hypothetical protein O2960_00020 [Verrucomicrobia bacterium]|nr:hypothetical protein [Verrucomicrobiota bacterium]